MMLYGREALADAELVALVLGGGRSMRRAVEVLERTGGLRGLASAGPHELVDIPGVGDAAATALVAAIELGRRIEQIDLPYATPMRGPDDVTRYLRALIGDAQQETFLVLGLDARQRVRLVRTVALGSVAQVDVHPREVFRPLVRAAMHSVVLVHNHPSGEPEPSHADLELTRRLAEVGRVVGIPVLDHLIVTRTRSLSLAALGAVPGTS
jgi:DNA repair protein RadC